MSDHDGPVRMKSLFESIGDYQIVEKLGRGGMADVYLAVDRKTSRRVALKLVERGQGPEAQEIVDAERLGAELQQHIGLADPRVPQIHAFGDLEGYFFIDMEFVEGTDLSALIEAGALKPEDAALIAMHLCSILRVAHGMSLQIDGRVLRAIVHGDIKPKNIRIDSRGDVRVLDFGIAKGLSITRRLTSNIFGSVAYSSPERLESGNIDEMSDLWAVGIVLYEMVEERLPFEAPSNERLEAIIRSRSILRPLKDSCPAELQQIIYKALARSPGSRYQGAAQFESDLKAFLSGDATVAAEEDEQTRRTVSMEDVETRRTAVAEPSGQAPVPLVVSRPESRFDRLYRESKQRLYLWRKWILAGSGVLLVGIGMWEGVVARTASQFKPAIIQGSLDADAAWARYQEIRSRSILGFATVSLRAPLRNLLVQSSEREFNKYLNSDALTVREGDWVRCARYLSHAIQMDLGDRKVEAMLEYANGHIFRINHKNLDAIAAFQHAAALQSKWADPYLGMARTYINNLDDMDRGTQALERAQELGHNFGKRELAMLAEAHRRRGLQEIENANLVRGTDQEKELLKKAKTDLNEALKNYLQIAPWRDSTAQIPNVQNSLGEIERRLSELEKPNPLLPWNWLK
jgi:eukaryotic-like serine/threonine-protein kinase